MIRKNIQVVVVMAVCCVARTAGAEGESTGDVAGSRGGTELVATVRFTKVQFEKLIGQMNEVAGLLEGTDPRSAKVLREAVNMAQRAFIAQDMTKVAELLSEGLAAAALKREDAVGRQLRRLLDVLRHGIMDQKDREKRIENYEAALERVEEFIKRQKDLAEATRLRDLAAGIDTEMRRIEAAIADIRAEQKKLLDETERLPPPDTQVRRLARLKDAIRDLIEKQGRLAETARTALPARLPLAGAAQKALAKQAGEIQKELKAAGEDKDLVARLSKAGADDKAVSKAAEDIARASGKMNQAGDTLSEGDKDRAVAHQRAAADHLEAARQALADAVAKMLGGSKSSEMSARQSKLAGRTREVGKALEKAGEEAGAEAKPYNLSRSASHMDKAAEELRGQATKAAAEEMKRALAELEEKKYQLAQLRRKTRQKATKPLDQQTREQSDLAGETGKAAEQMGKSPDSGPMPGQKPVAAAAGNMKQAAGKLDAKRCAAANASQKKALKDLEEARRLLEEAIAREKELLQLEAMVKIDAELQKILDGQKTISAATKVLHEKHLKAARESYDRAGELELAKLARGEGQLADKTDLIHKKLLKEGSTTVFPAVLEEVAQDLRSVAKLLADKNAGKITQGLQADVESALQEMIDAIRKEMSRRRRGGGGCSGGGGGRAPLVSKLAELRLLWRLEKQIRRRTVLLSAQKVGGGVTREQIEDLHKKLAGRQAKVKVMTEKLAKEMTR